MKKLLSIILTVALIICAVPLGAFTFTASAETSGTTGDCTWKLVGTVLTIGGNGKMGNYSYDSKLPWGKSITEVIINSGVTSIGNYAFYYCSSLTSVTIPDSVTSIGSSAFNGCSSLTSITIPDSVTSISNEAFYGCSSLESVTIPDSVTSIGNYAFAYSNSLASINIPNSVTSIDNATFSGCSSLASVTIPDSVTSIGWYAFGGCGSLTNINIPDSVTSIDGSAFYDTAYYNNDSNWQNGVLYINNHLIKAKETVSDSYIIKDDTKTIADNAFYDCSSLTNITIPNSVTSINYGAFEDCNSLTDVYYTGSKTEADKIDIGLYNDELENATWHYNCGTEVITPTETGIYSIAPNALKVFDGQNEDVVYKDGWSLVKGKNYTVIFENGNGGELKYSLIKNIDDLFPDTNSTDWYNDAVMYAVGKGIMSGYGNGNFGPSDSIQRQDFLVMLARFDGVDLSQYTGSSQFADVQTGSYYAAAVNWGADKGIVSGYQGGTVFGVGDVITREQLVTFLYRYASYKGIDVSYSNTTRAEAKDKYKDYSQVSDWSLDCVLWALENNVINGKNANTSSPTIAPQGNAQRCEVAQIMYNIFQNDVF